MKHCSPDHPDALTIPEAMAKIQVFFPFCFCSFFIIIYLSFACPQATVGKMNDDKKNEENMLHIRKLVASLKLDEVTDFILFALELVLFPSLTFHLPPSF